MSRLHRHIKRTAKIREEQDKHFDNFINSVKRQFNYISRWRTDIGVDNINQMSEEERLKSYANWYDKNINLKNE